MSTWADRLTGISRGYVIAYGPITILYFIYKAGIIYACRPC